MTYLLNWEIENDYNWTDKKIHCVKERNFSPVEMFYRTFKVNSKLFLSFSFFKKKLHIEGFIYMGVAK